MNTYEDIYEASWLTVSLFLRRYYKKTQSKSNAIVKESLVADFFYNGS